jgi:hypothetical protein
LSLSFRFPHQNSIHASSFSHPSYMSAHLILLDLITPTILGEEYRSLSSSLCSFIYCLVTSSLFGPNILQIVNYWHKYLICSISFQVSIAFWWRS